MNDFVLHSIPQATFTPTFGRLAFDSADDAAKRILLAQVQANQSYPEDRKTWFLEYTERASDLDMKMPNENFAIVRSSCAKSTVEDESDIAAVQSAFSALRKEKNAAVREALNDQAIDGNTASIELRMIMMLRSVSVSYLPRDVNTFSALVVTESAWFNLTSQKTIEDILSHPTSFPDVILEYAPNIGILNRLMAEETREEVAQLAHRYQENIHTIWV
ncbi:hypothetical protein BGW80DRAFT_1527758 [Lactifluus volemus]|nr:hypothetical protein BGW80DRAFT_1527758 [Lactifluus volemus]